MLYNRKTPKWLHLREAVGFLTTNSNLVYNTCLWYIHSFWNYLFVSAARANLSKAIVFTNNSFQLEFWSTRKLKIFRISPSAEDQKEEDRKLLILKTIIPSPKLALLSPLSGRLF
jgi:hypothetical protein